MCFKQSNTTFREILTTILNAIELSNSHCSCKMGQSSLFGLLSSCLRQAPPPCPFGDRRLRLHICNWFLAVPRFSCRPSCKRAEPAAHDLSIHRFTDSSILCSIRWRSKVTISESRRQVDPILDHFEPQNG